jgi:hypothetical protein
MRAGCGDELAVDSHFYPDPINQKSAVSSPFLAILVAVGGPPAPWSSTRSGPANRITLFWRSASPAQVVALLLNCDMLDLHRIKELSLALTKKIYWSCQHS